MTTVTSPLWKGAESLNAGFRYSSGTLHAAWDVGLSYEPIYAPCDGIILDCNDGVKNHPAGNQYAISNSPSNWILFGFAVGGHWYTLYLQHLSPGLKVKRGQRVKAGQQIAISGNTGNSSGPHLHWAAMKGKRYAGSRYVYLTDPSTRIFPPKKALEGTSSAPGPVASAKPKVSLSALIKAARGGPAHPSVLLVRKALGGTSDSSKWGPVMTRRYKKWQKQLGFKGKDANGVPGIQSLTELGKRSGFKVTA